MPGGLDELLADLTAEYDRLEPVAVRVACDATPWLDCRPVAGV